MSYTPPQSPDITFDFSAEPAYTPPLSGEIELAWGGLTADPVWVDATATYTLATSWSAIDGATEYRLRLLDGSATPVVLEEINTTALTHDFTGYAAKTTYNLDVTGLDGATELETLTAEATTLIGLPGGVSNLQHTFTTDSLTFTWGAATDAAEYLLTLSRDGTEVATQTVTTLTATFATLEDGTQYDLTIQTRNAKGTGPIAYYQATTGYIAPVAPTNLRQFEERIIAVICRWDLAEPDKVFDVEVQLLYGDELVLADSLEGPATERTIIVPMASTDYLLRVRAGNPGGWSAWAEATVSTEVFPLIDSRLGVMGATYQEDVLHTDTWDGASDQLKGVVEAVQAEAGVTVGGYSLAQSYFPPETRVVGRSSALSTGHFGPSITLSADERSIQQKDRPTSIAHPYPVVAISASEVSLKKKVSSQSEARPSATVQISGVENQMKYRQSTASTVNVGPAISISITEALS